MANVENRESLRPLLAKLPGARAEDHRDALPRQPDPVADRRASSASPRCTCPGCSPAHCALCARSSPASPSSHRRPHCRHPKEWREPGLRVSRISATATRAGQTVVNAPCARFAGSMSCVRTRGTTRHRPPRAERRSRRYAHDPTPGGPDAYFPAADRTQRAAPALSVEDGQRAAVSCWSRRCPGWRRRTSAPVFVRTALSRSRVVWSSASAPGFSGDEWKPPLLVLRSAGRRRRCRASRRSSRPGRCRRCRSSSRGR